MLLAACSSGGTVDDAVPSASPEASSAAPSPSAGSASPSATTSSGEARETTWLCSPDLAEDPCDEALPVTTVDTDGERGTGPLVIAEDPGLDCFYVYPTVSREQTRNASWKVTPEIVRVVRAQAVPFQSACRLFAPVYRQVTLRGLLTGGYADPVARGLAQGDVVAAFREYLARDNGGRPFVLLGHSQGATVLTSLVQSEVDGDPTVRDRLVSAVLLGSTVWLAPGSETRGTFQNVPPCRAPDQFGCVVTYATYAQTPPDSALFGRTVDGRRAICTNPAALAGGPAPLDPVLPVASEPGATDVVAFTALPDALVGECRSDERATWLQVARSPGSPLPESALAGDRGPAWGLHRLDVNAALGDLVALVERQADAWRAERT
jgi:hypothetical protein